MMGARFTFVWWGDGYFVYKDGAYIGKDDQVDLMEEMEMAGLAESLNRDEEVELHYGRETLGAMRQAIRIGGDVDEE